MAEIVPLHQAPWIPKELGIPGKRVPPRAIPIRFDSVAHRLEYFDALGLDEHDSKLALHYLTDGFSSDILTRKGKPYNPGSLQTLRGVLSHRVEEKFMTKIRTLGFEPPKMARSKLPQYIHMLDIANNRTKHFKQLFVLAGLTTGERKAAALAMAGYSDSEIVQLLRGNGYRTVHSNGVHVLKNKARNKIINLLHANDIPIERNAPINLNLLISKACHILASLTSVVSSTQTGFRT